MRDIPGFEGRYAATDDGRIWSYPKKPFSRGGEHNGLFLRPEINDKGYYSLNLTRNSKVYHRPVHRLVALAYLPNPNNLPCVNHKDGNKLNNNIVNLEWSSYRANNLHAYRTGLKKQSRKTRTAYSVMGKTYSVTKLIEVFSLKSPGTFYFHLKQGRTPDDAIKRILAMRTKRRQVQPKSPRVSRNIGGR